jgi:nucleotide sugar dehydrogenase
MTIGFIGQGFIGKHMADDFVARGYEVVRYALELEYRENKERIKSCDIVFIAVPTPTLPTGFDMTAIESALSLIGTGKTAVIKSTLLPGATKRLQATCQTINVLHSPEFLREKSAALDTREPARTIIGIPNTSAVMKEVARAVLSVLPTSPYTVICSSDEAELIKYAGNCFLAQKVVFMNLMYDAAVAADASYEVIAAAMAADQRIGTSHMNVIDQSGHPGSVPGRGAGGHCFPKDLAAFRAWYEESRPDDSDGVQLLKSIEDKNNQLLHDSHKDQDLLCGIYGASGTRI